MCRKNSCKLYVMFYFILQSKRKRETKNLTNDELEILISGLEEHWSQVCGSGPNRNLLDDRVDAFEIIAKKLRGVGPTQRSAKELRRKKTKWFSETKAKVNFISARFSFDI